ncbi:cyclic nucleotide-binding domain-containing protein [Sphingomonas sp. BIUV-7]|uniref:Cyclic nucleotide-binding domain-containing protein n=1 Tax=Sphingomonas natans TaxID=3063330 RepID=A0ABT8Y6Q7_9SPHN|nr:cyclic nucleotide-binding domain-containing protein [Sphingomonas sp. BIUV-7]MDO6413414.1 cyclic nucleotide-binding domain-containing protein [Sphingomonas sp. BIUV-7]
MANLLFGSALVLAAASVPRATLMLRAALVVVGGAGLAYVIHRRLGLGSAAACGALMTISFIQTLFSVRWGTKIILSAEEVAMIERCFPSIPRLGARQLLDQGLWMSGKAGETLLHEGTPATHLFYLSEGEVSVLSGGREVATSGPGHFFGEITVLSGGPATATVTLKSPARFWCATADSLHAFLGLYPEYRSILEGAFAGDLRDKLRLANQRMVSMEEAAAASG